MDFTLYYIFHGTIIGSMLLTGIALIVITAIFYHKASKCCKLGSKEIAQQNKE